MGEKTRKEGREKEGENEKGGGRDVRQKMMEVIGEGWGEKKEERKNGGVMKNIMMG